MRLLAPRWVAMASGAKWGEQDILTRHKLRNLLKGAEGQKEAPASFHWRCALPLRGLPPVPANSRHASRCLRCACCGAVDLHPASQWRNDDLQCMRQARHDYCKAAQLVRR